MSSNELIYMNWQQMTRPEKVEFSDMSATYGKFICEPLERGFGATIGNSLRRTILSSLVGAAITSVKIEGVMHELSVITGVLEDVSEIILNLKEIRLKTDDPATRTVRIDVKREGAVTAADIISDDGRVQVLNPNAHIATLTKKGSLKMTMTVKVGRGYELAEAHKDPDAPIGTIAIDAVFSPIKRVSYVVGNARVGQRTDYDRLTLEVWTDGSLTPDEAVAFAAKILKEQLTIFINFDENNVPEPGSDLGADETPKLNENLFRSVDELELSVRSANCLKNAEIYKIHQLVQRTEAEMLRTKNFGRKSLNEIKEVLSEMGLSFGMRIEKFSEEDVEKGE